jgi:hypothetical protein
MLVVGLTEAEEVLTGDFSKNAREVLGFDLFIL